jgi:hypothetical protein
MYTKIVNLFFIFLIAFGLLNSSSSVYGSGIRFQGDWKSMIDNKVGIATCQDTGKKCVESGIKEMDGIRESRPCWQYSYVKSCNFPSKNDCRIYEHCYALGDKLCLVRDYANTCVNMKKEFSCKSWEPVDIKDEIARMGLEAKDGSDGLVCKGVPCIDGNCVDKSYQTNGEMMDSISRLHAAKHMKPDADGKFNLFKGNDMHCSKKPVGANNCCKIGNGGWATSLGASCTNDEKTLADMRGKKLCVEVGTEKTGTSPVHVTKHYYCCFGNMLDKVIQVQGRMQLGKSWGSASSRDCSGLTLEEIQRIDFNKIDFTEFIEDFQKKFVGSTKVSNTGDIAQRIERKSSKEIRKGNDDTANKDNNLSGWHQSVNGASYETDTEGCDK